MSDDSDHDSDGSGYSCRPSNPPVRPAIPAPPLPPVPLNLPALLSLELSVPLCKNIKKPTSLPARSATPRPPPAKKSHADKPAPVPVPTKPIPAKRTAAPRGVLTPSSVVNVAVPAAVVAPAQNAVEPLPIDAPMEVDAPVPIAASSPKPTKKKSAGQLRRQRKRQTVRHDRKTLAINAGAALEPPADGNPKKKVEINEDGVEVHNESYSELLANAPSFSGIDEVFDELMKEDEPTADDATLIDEQTERELLRDDAELDAPAASDDSTSESDEDME